MSAENQNGIVLNEDRSVEAQLQRAKEERQKKLKKQKRRKYFLLGGAAVILVVIIVISSIISAFMKNAPMTVMVTNPTRGDLESTIVANGMLESEEVVNYYAPGSILVNEHAAQGDKVKAGDSIILFDEEDFAFALRESELENQITNNNYQSSLTDYNEAKQKLSTARANLSKYQELVLAQQAVVDELTKTITDANAIRAAKLQNNLYEAEKDLADYNYKILNADELGLSAEAVQTYMGYAQNKEKLISSIQYELNALSNSEKAYNDQKALAEAQNVLSDYKAEVEKAKAEIEAYEGVVGNQYDAENIVLNGELTTMRTEQSYQDLLACDGGVKAEFDGVISQCGIEAGAKTTAGTVMITLASLDDVKVSFGVTKSKLADVKVGQKAVVTVMDKEYEGTVSRIDSMATVGSNGSSSIMVDIHIDNPDNDIYLGLDARIELCTASKSDVVMLPVEAVSADKEGEFVYTVVDGIVVKKYVTLGISSDEYVEIIEGIEETDQVITMISAEIEEGIPVMAMPQMDSAELEMMMEGM